MNRIDRLFAITTLLQAHKRLRARDLARQFEVSERTIYRDMQALNESGVPVVALPGEGYELVDGFFLPPVRFTPAEAQAAFLSARMLEAHATGSLAAAVQNALAKLSLVLPAEARRQAELFSNATRFIVPPVQIDLDEPRLALLQQAILDHRVVWLRYHSHSQDELTERQVEPQTLSYYQGAWYVDGYCRLRGEPRGFRLNRIDDIRLLEEHFTPRLVFPPPVHPVDVRIRFAPETLRWVRERQHYAYQSEETTPSGTVMTYRVAAWSEIRSWLLGWGASAELLEPAHWRELLRQELKTLINLLT